MIKIDSLFFEYPNCKTRLQNINKEFKPSDIIAVCGENGSGKTTLLKIIAGFIKNYQGTVKVKPFKKIIYIPTELNNFLLPWYSVSKNFAFFFQDSRYRLELRDVSCVFEQVKFFLDEAKDNILERKIYEISSGEKAVMALICALNNNPDILILDELFSNTSPALTEIIINHLNSIFKHDKTVIFTSHNQQIVNNFATDEIRL